MLQKRMILGIVVASLGEENIWRIIRYLREM